MKSDAQGRIRAACMALLACAVGARAKADGAVDLRAAAHLLESEYESAIKGALQQYYTNDCIQIMGIAVDVDGAPHDGAVDGTEPAGEMVGRLEAEHAVAALKARTPVIPADRVRAAVGYDAERGDEVGVTRAPFDRTEHFAAEGAAFRRARRTKAGLLFAAFLWRRKRSPARAAGKS